MIVTTVPLEKIAAGQVKRFHLWSDLHIGNAFLNWKALKRDRALATSLGDPIAINGDVFDAILTKDMKRYSPVAIDALLQGRDDVVDGALDMAEEFLAPVAKQICVIGVGNHDHVTSRFGGMDCVKALIRRLNDRHGAKIAYGGYCGWIRVPYLYEKSKQKTADGHLIIQYHHGSGGAAPVTKGIIGFNRAQTWVEGADVIWRGHKHNRQAHPTLAMRLSPQGRPMERTVWNIMTGSYINTYKEQTSEDAMQGGRKASYAADWDVMPQAPGGIILETTMEAETRELKIGVRM